MVLNGGSNPAASTISHRESDLERTINESVIRYHRGKSPIDDYMRYALLVVRFCFSHNENQLFYINE